MTIALTDLFTFTLLIIFVIAVLFVMFVVLREHAMERRQAKTVKYKARR